MSKSCLIALLSFLPAVATAANPAVTYGTYFGGTGDSNASVAVAVDANGNVIVAGYTSSTTLPGTTGSYQAARAGTTNNKDVYIAKFDATGKTLAWATFLGGDGDDVPTALSVDSTGSIYVAGTTASANFPVRASISCTTAQPLQAACALPPSGTPPTSFVAKLSADGKTLIYSFGLSGGLKATALAANSAGNAYVGLTSTTLGLYLVGLNPSGNVLLFGDFLGRGTDATGAAVNAVATDSAGNVWAAGAVSAGGSRIPTTPNAFQFTQSNEGVTGNPGALNNGFLVKLNANGSQLYGTYLGPKNFSTSITGLVVNADGSVYVAGGTNATGFVATTGAFSSTAGAGYLAKLTLGLTTFDAFSYLPSVPVVRVGNQPSTIYAMFVPSGTQAGSGIEVAELSASALSLTSAFTTTFQGFVPSGLDLAPPHSFWIAGTCGAACNLGSLITADAYQKTPQTPSSAGALIALTDPASAPQLTAAVSHIGNFTQGQTGAVYTITIGMTGAASTGTVSVADTLPASMTAVSISGTGWTCLLASTTCTRSDSLAAGSTYPLITVAVNVGLTATSPVVNQVGATGGGAAAANATDSTTILAPFPDVTATDPFLPAINLLREYGITTGCGGTPTQYCPTQNVTRGQMAVFVVRSVMGNDNFTYTTTPYFADVPANHPFFSWIQKLRDLGVTSSCGSNALGPIYCPDDAVTRGQMAVFIIRDRFGATATFTFPTTPLFADVPATNTFFSWIQKMKQLGITSSCGSNTTGPIYCPDDAVTRGQMAVFIMRGAYNQLLPAGTPVIVSTTPPVGARGTSVTVTLTGVNTNWVNGTTQVSTRSGLAATNVVVTSSTTLTAQILISANAVPGPASLTATTGTEEATLPNGFVVQ